MHSSSTEENMLYRSAFLPLMTQMAPYFYMPNEQKVFVGLICRYKSAVLVTLSSDIICVWAQSRRCLASAVTRERVRER